MSANKFAFGGKPTFLGGAGGMPKGAEDDNVSQRSYQFMTPNSRGGAGVQSRKSQIEEDDVPNTDEFPEDNI